MDESVAAPRIKLKNRCKWGCFHCPMMILSVCFSCDPLHDCSLDTPINRSRLGMYRKNMKYQWLLIKTKDFDCRPALNPSRILLGEILGRFWEENPSRILQNVDKSWSGPAPGFKNLFKSAQGSPGSAKNLRDLRDLQKISGGKNAIPKSQIFSEKKLA